MFMNSNYLNYIKSRGYFNQCTDFEGLSAQLQNRNVTVYAGFDCTADSLHVGSLVQIMMLRLFQKMGCKVLILLGGGTTQIGDPSGKDETRQIMNHEKISYNKKKLEQIFSQFIKIGKQKMDAIILDNNTWLSNLNYIDFIRNYGSLFSVNRMLTFDSIKMRLQRQQNLSFLEFNYVLLQSYDFFVLNKNYGCNLQIGGSDQWGNIVSGIDLIKKFEPKKAVFGLTSPLITTSSGEKMGKTADGAIWLTEEKFDSYNYWQFWRNTEDKDVIKFLKLFTEIGNDEILKLESLKGHELNEAKKLLANEATRICHGEEKSRNAENDANKIFSNNIEKNISESHKIFIDLKKNKSLREILVELNFSKSLSESKRLIESGGVKINSKKIIDKNYIVKNCDFERKDFLQVSVGKKKHGIIQLE